MMLDDGDYIVIGKLIAEGECRGKGIQRCHVSFTYVMIETTHAHTPTCVRVLHIKREGQNGRDTYTHVDNTQTHTNRVNIVIMKL